MHTRANGAPVPLWDGPQAEAESIWDPENAPAYAIRGHSMERVLPVHDPPSTRPVSAPSPMPERTVWNAVRRLRQAQIVNSRGPLERPVVSGPIRL